MFKWFKKQKKQVIKLPFKKELNITLGSARAVRLAKIKLNDKDEHFDFFGKPSEQYKILYSNPYIAINVIKVLLNDESDYEEFEKKFENIPLNVYGDQIVRAWINFFTLPPQIREEIKAISIYHQKRNKLIQISLSKIGNTSIQQQE